MSDVFEKSKEEGLLQKIDQILLRRPTILLIRRMRYIFNFLVRLPICSFVRSFGRTFVRSFIRWFVRPFIRSFVRPDGISIMVIQLPIYRQLRQNSLIRLSYVYLYTGKTWRTIEINERIDVRKSWKIWYPNTRCWSLITRSKKW